MDGHAGDRRRRAHCKDLDAAVTAATAIADLLSEMDPNHLTVDRWQRGLGEIGLRLAALRAAGAKVSTRFGLSTGQARLLRYLQMRSGEVVAGDELAGVAGISDWARRVRELRVDHGWPIETGTQRPDLRPDEYVLIRNEKDPRLVSAWKLAKELRDNPQPVKDRLLEYLRQLSPDAADQDQLSHVAKTTSYVRHLEQLRAEGWNVQSRADDSDLATGAYRLGTPERRASTGA